MNIFVTDISPTRCARSHCDKHLVKMILETAQLLSCSVLFFNSSATGLYRKTHVNHPCSIWSRETVSNFQWLQALGLSLCEEYRLRYGKVHKSRDIICNASLYESYIPSGDMTPFAQAMPEQLRSDSAVFSYRKYIRDIKIPSMKFTFAKRSPPEWITEGMDVFIDGDVTTIKPRL